MVFMNLIHVVDIENNYIYLMLQGNMIGRLDKDKKEITAIITNEEVNSILIFEMLSSR